MTNQEDAALLRRRKQALFRAQRRGFKDVELVFATFAGAEAMTLASGELEQFESLLDVPDLDVYSWLTGAEPLPCAFDTPVFARLKALCNRTEPTWTV